MSRITQRGATGPLALVANGAFQTTTDTNLQTLTGSRWDLSDGREVALVFNSAAGAIAAGLLVQGPAFLVNHQDLVTVAYVPYSNNGNVPAKVTVTLGNTLVTANQYTGGFVIVNSGTGIGQTLKIASHPAANALANLVLTLEEGATVALVAGNSKVCLSAPQHVNVVVHPTASTGAAVGVTLYALPVSSFGFVVTRGQTACLNDAGTTVGYPLMRSSNTAGAVMTAANTGDFVGNSSQAGVTTESRMITVNL